MHSFIRRHNTRALCPSYTYRQAELEEAAPSSNLFLLHPEEESNPGISTNTAKAPHCLPTSGFCSFCPHFWHTDPCSLRVDSLPLILQFSALSLLLLSLGQPPGPPSLQSPHSGLFGVVTGLHLKLDVSSRRAVSGTTAAPAP